MNESNENKEVINTSEYESYATSDNGQTDDTTAETDETVNIEQENTPLVQNSTEDETEVVPKQDGVLKKINRSFHGRKFRNGAYTTVISAVVIVILIVINIFATQLKPTIDLSPQSMYTLTSDTKNYIKSVKDKIKIYYLVETGNEQKKVAKIVEKYDKIGKNVSVEYIDPILHPTFAQKYTDEKIVDNSVIVVNETNGKSKYLTYNSMLQSQMDYQTYQSYVTGVDVEGQVTAAIQYVTAKNLPIMYVIDGHGETKNGSSFTSLLEKQNLDIKTLTTMSEKSIPSDCAVLLAKIPTQDYTEEEVSIIEDYIANGGNMIIVGNYTTNDLKNFNALVNYYGVEFVKGFVIEGNKSNMVQSPQILLPNITDNSITKDVISKDVKSYIVTRYASGIKQMETKRNSLSFESLVNTSDKAFSRVGDSQKTSKQTGDIDGPFDLAVSITETNNNKESKVIVLGSDDFVNDDAVGDTSFINYKFMSSIVNYTAGVELKTLNIPVRSVNNTGLVTTTKQFAVYFTFTVLLLPALVIAAGVVVVLMRRKK